MTNYTCRNCGKELSGNWLYCSNECQTAAALKKPRDLLKTLPKSSYGHGMLPGAEIEKSRYSPGTLPKTGYGHTALQQSKSKFVYGRVCSHCEKLHKRNSQYCSNACKQAAYRKRLDPNSGSWENRKARAQRAVHTKQWALKTVVCEHCGDERRFSIAASTNRIYCSDRCKQAAYRQRKQAND